MDFENVLTLVREKKPLVQCITNVVTVNDCANIILASGGSPTMASHPLEVEEAVRSVQSLVCNMGAIDKVESMILAGKEANRLGIPVILDPVGAGGTQLRRDAVKRLLEEVHFTVIRGNASEIRYLAGDHRQRCGCQCMGRNHGGESGWGCFHGRGTGRKAPYRDRHFRKARCDLRRKQKLRPAQRLCHHGPDHRQRLYADGFDRSLLWC